MHGPPMHVRECGLNVNHKAIVRVASISSLLITIGGPITARCQSTLPAGPPPFISGGGQGYPNKPIRVFTAGTGGSSDLVARTLAQEISIPLGQRAVVEN